MADVLFNKNRTLFQPQANLPCPLAQYPPQPKPQSTNKTELDACLRDQASLELAMRNTKSEIYYSSYYCANNFINP